MDSSMNKTLYIEALVVLSVTGFVATVTCLSAIIAVVAMRFIRLLVYRLALYQVIMGLLSALACVLEIFSLFFYDHDRPHHPACSALGFMINYFFSAKLLFTMWLTVHLFAYSICYRNLKKLEPVYVATSLLVPALVSIVPLITNSYGLAGSWCWIGYGNQSAIVIEQFALWYGPSLALLLIESAAVSIMFVVLLHRNFTRKRYALLVRKERPAETALRQLLPLLAYPIAWCVLSVLPLTDRILIAYGHSVRAMATANAFCTAGWSLSSGVVLLVHIGLIVSGKIGRADRKLEAEPNEDSTSWTSTKKSDVMETSATHALEVRGRNDTQTCAV